MHDMSNGLAVGSDRDLFMETMRRLERSARFLFIRHGESEGNAAGMVQGHFDAPLNENGRSQARAAAAWFAATGARRLVCSPLSRARETAELLAASVSGCAVEVDHSFREIDTGSFSGRLMERIRVEEPESYRRYEELSWDGVPGAEGSSSLFDRALSCWSVAVDAVNESGGPFVAVSHGGLLQWIVRTSFGCRSWFPLVPTGNCRVFELEASVSDSGAVRAFWRKIDWQPFPPMPTVAQAF